MSQYARIQNGVVVELITPSAPIDTLFTAAFVATLVESDGTPGVEIGWLYNGTAFSAPPPPPAPTLAQQAAALIGAGITITSTGTPGLNGTYACDDSAQSKISRMYDLIQRAGGNAFPAGLTELPWLDLENTVHVFPTPAQFLDFETAVGDFVLACDLIIATGTGTLPAAAATIP